MLFNSSIFIFVFLPIVLAGFFALARWRILAATGWLVLASLAFYAWWNPAYLILLLASIAFNFAVGRALGERNGSVRGRGLLALGVAANLALLGYYKYANFFVESAGRLAGAEWQLDTVVLPLGISFYTFTQIAYLVDAFQGKAREYNPLHYALFVSYFPHLVAGPILHHGEMMPQFADRKIYSADSRNLAVGLSIFTIGMFKKVVLADGVAPFANNGFNAVALGHSLTFVGAWGAALAYTVQLYFDFSGYSDMAVGISRLFGVQLPVNFHSPYKSESIVEFWRRWHMTLSRFLRDYLYIPLGGNRHGTPRRYANLLVTMVLGGLWHGAGWTFVIWGALHGVYLVVNQVWQTIVTATGFAQVRDRRIWRLAAWFLTFISVVVAWVFFRSDSLESAISILRSMSGANGIALPDTAIARLGVLGEWLVRFGAIPGDAGVAYGGRTQFAWIGGLLAIALFMPNTQQIMSRFEPGLRLHEETSRVSPPLAWAPTTAWAIVISAMLFWCMLNLGMPSDFLYWQF